MPEGLAVGDLNEDGRTDIVASGGALYGAAGFAQVLLYEGGTVTGVEPSPPVDRNGLAQNRPNPFNPRTEISFELARSGPATLRVYDASGRLVRALFEGSLGAGPHRVGWDGLDAQGRKASSGVYFYRLAAPGFESARKMLLLK
jgi:hypothetical protein